MTVNQNIKTKGFRKSVYAYLKKNEHLSGYLDMTGSAA